MVLTKVCGGRTKVQEWETRKWESVAESESHRRTYLTQSLSGLVRSLDYRNCHFRPSNKAAVRYFWQSRKLVGQDPGMGVCYCCSCVPPGRVTRNRSQ
jgi:hypothetical protein